MKPIDGRLDDAWSELVKLRAGGRCEVCKRTRTLNSHHVYSRAIKSVRWDVLNGYCLCVGHHIGVKFSAHKTPSSFTDWMIKDRGRDWHDILMAKANSVSKLHDFEKKLLLKELQKEIAIINLC